MGQAIFWSNVGIDVQTALATAISLSAISKASPGVATYTGATNPANGDYIVMTSNGMFEVSNRIFRVANVNTGGKTFELEGEDTTTYNTFTSGSFQQITFGASMTIAQNIAPSGGDLQYADTTTVHDNVQKRAPTIVSPLSLAMDAIFDVTDPAYIEMNKAYKSKTVRAIRLRFGTGFKMLMTGYCGAPGVPSGQNQGIVQMKLSVEGQNIPTVYST
jgi:hypothetical protein